MVDRIDNDNRAAERRAAERSRANQHKEAHKQAGTDFASRFQSKIKTSSTKDSQAQKQDQQQTKEELFSKVLSTYRGKEESGQQQNKQDSAKKEHNRKEDKFHDEVGEERTQSRSSDGHERVAAKQSQHQDGGGTGGGGSGGGSSGNTSGGQGQGSLGGNASGSGGSGGGRQSDGKQTQASFKGSSSFAVKQVGSNFGAQTGNESGDKGDKKRFSQKNLDDLVAAVSVGLNEHLEEEMKVDLTDEIFSGLKLKATRTSLGIVVTFICPNRVVKETFAQQRQQIYARLKAKNILVHRVEVIS